MTINLPNAKSLLLLWAVFLSVTGFAQTAAPTQAATGELVDVVSFFNGGYYYRNPEPRYIKGITESPDKVANQLRAISRLRTVNPFSRDDRKAEEGPREASLFYALAAPATIETFRVTGNDENSYDMPSRFEFAVSQSPDAHFQTVAVFDVPASYLASPRVRMQYDFSIPARQKISGRYVRVILSGSKYGSYRLSRFSAYGRFNEAAALREDFSGVYHIHGWEGSGSPAHEAMVSQQKGTGYYPYLILRQQGAKISGCYVYGANDGRGKNLQIDRISEVLGTLEGGVENNVFRFTRTYAADGSQSQGAMALDPIAAGIPEADRLRGYMLIENDAPPDSKKGNPAFEIDLRLLTRTLPPCAALGQKEKTAVENMKASIEKAGKVQLYGVNFDFDSDVLRPESGPVLDEVVKLAQANPGWKFEIGGHTDSLGAADYNLKLSERRAASVVRYLSGKGVDAARLQAQGYGATRPLVPETGGSEAARSQNRRVELVKR